MTTTPQPTKIRIVAGPVRPRQAHLKPVESKTHTVSDFVPPPPAKWRKLPFAYNPGPTSIILVKVLATESLPANAARLKRQRQFCARLKAA